jgi:hypothetical protein
MTTSYPTTKQTFKDYVTGNKLITSEDLNQVRDTVEALEDKIGITNDPNTNTIEYKLNQIGSRNVANGYPGLDGSGKLLFSQLPASAMEYKGNWDASNGSFPASPSIGDVYIVSVQGTISSVTYTVGSQIVYNGASWDYYPAALTQPDATYSVKGILKLLTDAVTSGLTIAGGVLSVNTGTGANQIVKLDANAKLPAIDASNLTGVSAGSKSGSFTRNYNTASGAQTIAHGLGRIPKTLRIDMIGANGITNRVSFSRGVFTVSGTNCVYKGNSFISSYTDTAGTNTNIIYLDDVTNGVGPTTNSATVTVDATNITLTWTLTGSGLAGFMHVIWDAN